MSAIGCDERAVRTYGLQVPFLSVSPPALAPSQKLEQHWLLSVQTAPSGLQWDVTGVVGRVECGSELRKGRRMATRVIDGAAAEFVAGDGE